MTYLTYPMTPPFNWSDGSDGSDESSSLVVSATWCVYSSPISSLLLKSETVDSETNDVLLDRALRIKSEWYKFLRRIFLFLYTPRICFGQFKYRDLRLTRNDKWVSLHHSPILPGRFEFIPKGWFVFAWAEFLFETSENSITPLADFGYAPFLSRFSMIPL